MPMTHVGQPRKRVEDPKLVTGRGPYVNDVRVANALAMVVVAPRPAAHPGEDLGRDAAAE